MTRPADLPEFEAPPLNEVVLGIQFDPPRGYQQILAGEIWGLFREAFPKAEERPALPPSFETFGPPGSATLNLHLTGGATHDRFWFISQDGTQLIQFQNDRLLHNWRKTGTPPAEYPRFEPICENFKAEVEAVQRYMERLGNPSLVVRQCEISYINLIYPKGLQIGNWLKALQFDGPSDDFNFVHRRIIESGAGRPIGRLITEAVSAFDGSGAPVVRLSLTVRGLPTAPTIGSAIEFLTSGREIIVREFCAMTTESAHKVWRRMR